jgi:kinesin family member C2/C3
MSYGQTGSGKTYTMVGDDRNPGLYFTAVDEIYKVMKQDSDRFEYQMQVSVVEIYNEKLKDLLVKD